MATEIGVVWVKKQTFMFKCSEGKINKTVVFMKFNCSFWPELVIPQNLIVRETREIRETFNLNQDGLEIFQGLHIKSIRNSTKP